MMSCWFPNKVSHLPGAGSDPSICWILTLSWGPLLCKQTVSANRFRSVPDINAQSWGSSSLPFSACQPTSLFPLSRFERKENAAPHRDTWYSMFDSIICRLLVDPAIGVGVRRNGGTRQCECSMSTSFKLPFSKTGTWSLPHMCAHKGVNYGLSTGDQLLDISPMKLSTTREIVHKT